MERARVSINQGQMLSISMHENEGYEFCNMLKYIELFATPTSTVFSNRFSAAVIFLTCPIGPTSYPSPKNHPNLVGI